MNIKTHRLDSKNQISKAALSLFIKKGIKATTTREIAKKAGIAEGTIYRHFKSKNDIASKLFLNYMTMFRDRLYQAEEEFDDPRGSIKKMIHVFFEFAKNEPKAYNYIMAAHYSELRNKKGHFQRGFCKNGRKAWGCFSDWHDYKVDTLFQ
jgi:AcrR family transcriptional regulator